MAAYIKSLFWLGACSAAGYVALLGLTPNDEELKKKMNFVDQYSIDMQKKKGAQDQPKQSDFARVIRGTANAQETIYGAASAKAQGLNDTKR